MSTYPPAEAVETMAGGSTDWAELSPGQRVTFIQWAAQRGFGPEGGSADVYSPIPPNMVPLTETSRILSSPGPAPNILPGLGSSRLELSPDFWLGLAALLIGGAIVLYLVGKNSPAGRALRAA